MFNWLNIEIDSSTVIPCIIDDESLKLPQKVREIIFSNYPFTPTPLCKRDYYETLSTRVKETLKWWIKDWEHELCSSWVFFNYIDWERRPLYSGINDRYDGIMDSQAVFSDRNFIKKWEQGWEYFSKFPEKVSNILQIWDIDWIYWQYNLPNDKKIRLILKDGEQKNGNFLHRLWHVFLNWKWKNNSECSDILLPDDMNQNLWQFLFKRLSFWKKFNGIADCSGFIDILNLPQWSQEEIYKRMTSVNWNWFNEKYNEVMWEEAKVIYVWEGSSKYEIEKCNLEEIFINAKLWDCFLTWVESCSSSIGIKKSWKYLRKHHFFCYLGWKSHLVVSKFWDWEVYVTPISELFRAYTFDTVYQIFKK